MKKYIEKMTGFKATDKDMTCKGHAFKLNEWAEIGGDLKLCEHGFHFCVHPSGTSCYYEAATARIFKVEAEQVLECPTEAGADFKLVAKRIRLIEEITPGMTGNDKSNTGFSNTGNRNTGGRNTGDSNTGFNNTGDSNTGGRNTGDSNTGGRNTGDSNTGFNNTGDSNTGDRNTGFSNTGNRNTGFSNTGNRNTGDRNTGFRNTGSSNTGYWNATNHSAGFFCQVEPLVVSFDKKTKLTRDQFSEKYPEARELGELLHRPEPIAFEPFKHIPGITKAKLASLHAKHLAAKKQTPSG